MPDGFAMLHKPDGPDEKIMRKAESLFRDMCKKYGRWHVEAARSREMIVYLDLASHELFPRVPADFDACHRVVEEATFSKKAGDTMRSCVRDVSLSALIELIPRNPESPFAAALQA